MPFIRQQTGDPPQGPLALHTLFGGSHHFYFNPDHTPPSLYTPDTDFQLPDISGQGVTCNQTGADSPIYTASDATLGGRATFAGNGSNKHVFLSWNPPAPATTNVWWYLIAKQNTWGDARFLIGGASTTNMGIRGSTGTPQVSARNGGTLALKSMTLGTWFRIMVLFTGVAGNDRFMLGSSESTGLDLGNSNPTASGLFCTQIGGVPGTNSQGDFTIALAYGRVGRPSDSLIAQADAQAIARYGAGLEI